MMSERRPALSGTTSRTTDKTVCGISLPTHGQSTINLARRYVEPIRRSCDVRYTSTRLSPGSPRVTVGGKFSARSGDALSNSQTELIAVRPSAAGIGLEEGAANAK